MMKTSLAFPQEPLSDPAESCEPFKETLPEPEEPIDEELLKLLSQPPLCLTRKHAVVYDDEE